MNILKTCGACGKVVNPSKDQFMGVQDANGFDLALYNCSCGGTYSIRIPKESNGGSMKAILCLVATIFTLNGCASMDYGSRGMKAFCRNNSETKAEARECYRQLVAKRMGEIQTMNNAFNPQPVAPMPMYFVNNR